MGGIAVTLTSQEMMLAAYAGVRRCVASISQGLTPALGCKQEDIWGIHVHGAGGELATAKVLNVYWDAAFNTFSRGDVGAIQVRTRSSHDWELIVREKDADQDEFVLVTGTMPSFIVHGWISGKAAKDKRWLRTHGGRPGAYFVPQSELLPLAALPIKNYFDPTLARKSEAG